MIFHADLNVSNHLEFYCAYNEGSGNGLEKIKVKGDFDVQSCANKCFQMRLDGNGTINGATLDQKTCYCEFNQTHSWYSRLKKNCQFKTNRKPMDGEYFIHFLSHTQHIHMIFGLAK